ncbi:hypothetical protein [Pseudovibrio exalbescens]|uniref:hypothetical protein n=1 Tax=Pseudovibrio exalbescens TaxID=197461 RepID=UPI000C9B90DD|nr:hypothetical protein [Pseudovibrio exalbescens]
MLRLSYILLGGTTLVVGGLVALSLSGSAAENEVLEAPDASGLRILGDSVALAVNTEKADKNQIRVKTSDYKWCDLKAHLSDNGVEVTIEMERSAWSALGLCDPEATVELPESWSLDVALDAMAAHLTGNYEQVRLKTDRAALHFSGSADAFELIADAAVVYLDFLAPITEAAVNIEVNKLVSSINYAD